MRELGQNEPGAVRHVVGIRNGVIPDGMRLSDQAVRSIGLSMSMVWSVCQPSTLRMLLWPEASRAQNKMAAVSADGSAVCVLILRLNSSCSRSIALAVRTPRHRFGGSRAKVKRRSPASSRLSATALVDPSILYAPSRATAAGAEQCGIIVTDNECHVDPPLR